MDAEDRLPITGDAAEIVPLAAKFSKAFMDFVAYYQETYSLSPEDAYEKARLSIEERQKILSAPPKNVSWIELGQLSEADPDEGLNVWRRVRSYARYEIVSGQRAADVVSHGFDFGPMAKARFLEIRQALRQEWEPGEGSESALIDMLAQIQTAWETWLSTHILQINMQAGHAPPDRRPAVDGAWLPPRLSEAESTELSATMVDRFNKMYLRTLRALRDLRRHSPQIVVQSAGQVNVANQQVNVTSDLDAD